MRVPYLNKLESFGLNTHIELFRKKKHTPKPMTINFLYFENDENTYTSNELLFEFEIIYNKNFNTKHQLNFDYHNVKIDEEISALNPNYLLSGRAIKSTADFYKISYQFIKEKRDNNIYPTKRLLYRF